MGILFLGKTGYIWNFVQHNSIASNRNARCSSYLDNLETFSDLTPNIGETSVKKLDRKIWKYKKEDVGNINFALVSTQMCWDHWWNSK